MVKPHFHSNVKEMLGEDFSNLLYEISPFVEPRVDILQSNGGLIISVDLAGAGTDDFTVRKTNHALCIEGIIQNKLGSENEKVIIRRERFYGPFKRELPIPEECDLQRIQAVFERGVLVITIPFYKNKR
ncbi:MULTISPECIES: Hsp20/alpha crystallin family protein [Bacillus]|uniref:Hsp20/alpha crystallin family protein n=1 Tax=Bacillus glycinifermentans TaxID=1664069 RepID=A0AAJ4D0W7_9BACI|nr:MULTISPECIES: Hsp20/alpha crystallin family protein [Bacillus]KKB75517.1 hypothetical protein TH62_01500 [Bacillus sp. TH008]MDU0071211.1 Hsp20/alpha crystallin family protein [Bacillus sp. IG6]MED8019079.1 Hsp20/alpha crystallin family protein [Bacillus glycinifermentans]QAT63733.1 Hsp20/alpha crystallin family protein [Bacillus glycinifermentans]WKB77605.1 Hsp20/alpha crystallin family protein [Bacillus glycinifermentans]